MSICGAAHTEGTETQTSQDLFFLAHTLLCIHKRSPTHTGDILSQHGQAVELLTGLQNGTMGILGPLR